MRNTATPASRPLPPFARPAFITVTSGLVLVSGLLGLLASILMIAGWQMLRRHEPISADVKEQFRFTR